MKLCATFLPPSFWSMNLSILLADLLTTVNANQSFQ